MTGLIELEFKPHNVKLVLGCYFRLSCADLKFEKTLIRFVSAHRENARSLCVYFHYK